MFDNSFVTESGLSYCVAAVMVSQSSTMPSPPFCWSHWPLPWHCILDWGQLFALNINSPTGNPQPSVSPYTGKILVSSELAVWCWQWRLTVSNAALKHSNECVVCTCRMVNNMVECQLLKRMHHFPSSGVCTKALHLTSSYLLWSFIIFSAISKSKLLDSVPNEENNFYVHPNETVRIPFKYQTFSPPAPTRGQLIANDKKNSSRIFHEKGGYQTMVSLMYMMYAK